MPENPSESHLIETFTRLWDQLRQITQADLLDPARLERALPLGVARIRELNPDFSEAQIQMGIYSGAVLETLRRMDVAEELIRQALEAAGQQLN
jgi:ribosomal protein S18 acetylase RimI-like enzyme